MHGWDNQSIETRPEQATEPIHITGLRHLTLVTGSQHLLHTHAMHEHLSLASFLPSHGHWGEKSSSACPQLARWYSGGQVAENYVTERSQERGSTEAGRAMDVMS